MCILDTHGRYHAGVRRTVHSVLLIAQRLQSYASHEGHGDSFVGGADAVEGSPISSRRSRVGGAGPNGPSDDPALLLLPVLPPEMWCNIMSFVLRRHFAAFTPHPLDHKRVMGGKDGVVAHNPSLNKKLSRRAATNAAVAMNAEVVPPYV